MRVQVRKLGHDEVLYESTVDDMTATEVIYFCEDNDRLGTEGVPEGAYSVSMENDAGTQGSVTELMVFRPEMIVVEV